MKSLVGKRCLLEIFYHNNRLFYHVQKVLEVSNTHITFLDKDGKMFSFRLMDVVEANQIEEAG